MDSKIKKHCPNCSKKYCLRAHQNKTYVPLQLPCGHNICENCIKNKVKFSEPIECKVCKIEITLSTSERQIIISKETMMFEKFSIDYYMYGQLSAELTYSEGNNINNDVNYSQDYTINLRAFMKDPVLAVANCAECKGKSHTKCEQCEIILCDLCFAKIHKFVQSFKHHTSRYIDYIKEENNCPTHTDKALDYYCKDCDVPKCIDCTFLGGEKSCKKHDIVPLREKNLEMAKHTEDLARVLDERIRHLSATANQNAYFLRRIDDGESKINDIIKDAQNYYAKLRYAIQKAEAEDMSALENVKKMQKESLLQTRKEIQMNFQTITNILNMINGDVREKPNILKILETAKNATNLPYLLLETQNNNDFGLEVNEDLFKNVNDFIKFNDSSQPYKLVGINDIPEGVTIPDAPNYILYPPESSGDVREKIKQTPNSSNPTQTFSFCKKSVPSFKKVDNLDQLSTCSNESAVSEVEDVKPLRPGNKEMVFLTHIEDYHNFYALRVRHQKLLDHMAEEFQEAHLLPRLTKDRIDYGQIYLGYRRGLRQWQRCRVEKNCHGKNEIEIIELFFIDYGVTEFATVNNVRQFPDKRFSNLPTLAVHCKLANCEPLKGIWTQNDSLFMYEIVTNKKAILFVRSDTEPGGKYLCDVVMYENDMSLAHSLAFHERARLINPQTKPPSILQFCEKLKINSVNDLDLNSTHEVFITHVVNPDKFFVRQSHLMSTYNELCQEMNKAYKDSWNPVHCPAEGMICAIDASNCSEVADSNSSWRRAVVRALLGKQRVTVYLPDTGEVYKVHYTALRRIMPIFVKNKALAIQCNLSCVITTKKMWCQESIKLLEKYRNTLLLLQVDKDVRNRDSTSVVLRYLSDQNDASVCINNELVEKHLAIASGTPVFTRISTFVSLAESIQKKKSKKDDEQNVKPVDKGPIKRAVRILYCGSPSLIYVSLVDQKEIMHKLYKEIRDYCSINKPCDRQWQVGDRCIGFCNGDKIWSRAIITELHDGEAALFFTDFANTEKVSLSKMMELPSHLAKIDDDAIKCHMSGVAPGISGDWPSVTKEYLRELIGGYKRFSITENGTIEDKSLPIELWVFHKTPGGALEPDRTEWRCLNYKIIEEGLGIPEKSHKNTFDAQHAKEVLLSMAGRLNESSSSSEFVEPKKEHEVTSDWIPAVPLESAEFIAVSDYIDNEAVIYLHNVTQEETRNNLCGILAKINSTASTTAIHTDWVVGEPCLAKYSVDKKLYRGRIVKIYPEEYKCCISYVDHGNEEIRSLEYIRTINELCDEMLKIPIMAYRCKLAHVKPLLQERWEPNTLQHIRNMVIGSTCLVRVIDNKVNDLIPIEIKVKGLWLHQNLLDTHQVVFDRSSQQQSNSTASLTDSDYVLDESDSVSLKTIESIDSDNIMTDESFEEGNCFKEPKKGKVYKFEKNIMEKESFKCTILVITHFDSFNLLPELDTEKKYLYQKVSEEMQLKGDDMPEVNGVYENKACIAHFPDDKVLWYRTSILEYSVALQKVKVKYVDYGNIEIVPLSQVKEIDPKWINPPPATVEVKIYGYVRNREVDDEVFKEEYVKAFLDKTLQVNVIEKDYDSVLLVELRDVTDNTLVYQPLIDKKMFLKINGF